MAYSWSARDDEEVYNGNRTEWSPIRSVIMWVIDRIVRGRLISFKIICMITDRIGPNEVLLQINHNYNKICDVLALLKIKTQEIPRVFLLVVKKKPFKCAHVIARYYISVLFHWAFLFVVYLLSLFCCCSIKPFMYKVLLKDKKQTNKQLGTFDLLMLNT